MKSIIENFLSKFIRNVFGTVYTITPTIWNTKVLFLNIKIAGIIGFIQSMFLAIGLFILLAIFNIFISPWWYILIVGVICGYTIYSRSFINEYSIVEGGHFGIIAVQGEIKGDMKHPYILSDGHYREVIKIPFFPDMFEIYSEGKKMKAFEYPFKQVRSRNGIPFAGRAGFIPFIIDPYQYATMILSIGEDELTKRIEEICLRAMNGSFNEYDSDFLIAGVNSAEKLERNFFDTLEKQINDCSRESVINFFTKQEIHGDSIFKIEGTGLAGRFYITNSNPPDDLIKEYTHVAKEPQTKKRIIIQAQAEAEKTVIQAEAKAQETKIGAQAQAEAEQNLAEKRVEIIKRLSNQISILPAYADLNPKEIKDMVEAAMGAYESELKEHRILDVRGLEDLASSIEKLFGLFKNK